MVAIFTGAGAGFTRGSTNLLGGAGQLGTSLLGRGGESVSVNAATGNLLISHQDEFLIGRGPDVAIGRTYNSIGDAADGDNGDNWQQSTTRRVFGLTGTLNAADSTVKRLGADGAVLVYEWDGARSAYVTEDGAGAFDTLTNASGTWTWRDGDTQATETYADYGGLYWHVTGASDTDGNTLTFSYTGDKLNTVTTADGSWTQYSWSGNQITSVATGYIDLASAAAKTLTRVRYGYDGQGRLQTVTTDLTPEDNSVAAGPTYVTSYTYDGASNRVASIAQSDGSLLAIAYDGSGRVQTLTQTVAAGVTRVTTLAYGANYTTVTGPDAQAVRLDYDASQRLTKITAPPATSGATAQTVQFAYDADGNLDTVTDGAGKVTSYDYDGNGNATLITDPTGNVVTRTFDAQNRLITELTTGADRDGASIAHYRQYVYDTEGHLRFAVNAAGQTTEYRYNAAGEVTRTLRYVESRYTPPGATAITEAQMVAWAAGLTTMASVEVAENTYDTRGNLTSSKTFGIADSAGNPLTTEGSTQVNFTYDQAGQMLDRWRAGENHETFLYDGMGRLYSSSDKNGGTTTITFADAASTTTVTTASGFSSVSVYNKSGELVSVTESGTSTTAGTATYEYDAAGQLRIVTDASGRKAYIYYDKAGRKVAEVNHLGEITEFRYDAAGRVAATVAYSTPLGTTPFDTIKNLAATADLSTLLPTASASDVWTWTIYDDAGRVIQQIDNLGSTATYTYDTEGKLAQTYSYFTKLSTGTLTGFKTNLPTALTLPAGHAKDTFSRVFYNKAGQQIGTLDGEGYLTEITRDGTGKELVAVAYAAATVLENRASGTFGLLKAGLSAPTSDRTVRSVYDGQGLLRYSINARGGITGFTYDDAGRLTKTTAYAIELTLTDVTYDAVKAAVTNNLSNRTSWVVYDAAGRAAYSVDAEGGVAAFSYDTSGRVVKAIAYDNLYSSSVSLASLNSWAANSAQSGDAANRVTRTWYNARGDVAYASDAANFVTGFAYDQEGRVLSTVRYGGSAVALSDATTIANFATLLAGAPTTNAITTSVTYDNAGHVLTSTDGEGAVTRNTYNALGQLFEVTEAYGHANAVTTRFTYDGAGRVLTQTAAYGTTIAATVTYAYDGLGNRTTVTDARGNAINYTFDKLGQVLTGTDALSGVTTYVYDAFGNVVKATGPGGKSSYNYYDNLGRLTLTANGEKFITTIAYNRFSEVSSSSRYSVAFAGTLTIASPPSTSGLGAAVVSNQSYDRLGQSIMRIDAGGYVETSAYNAFGELTQFARYATSSFNVPGASGPTQAEVNAAYAAASQAQATATSARTTANQAAATAASAAATAAPLVAAANTAQSAANAANLSAAGATATAQAAQTAANNAQAAADAALAHAHLVENGDPAGVLAAYALAAQLQTDANTAQTASTAAAAAAVQAQTNATAAATAATQAATAATQANSVANTAEAAAATAQTAATTAATQSSQAQATANTKQATANASAAAAATAQTNANTLATQLSQNAVAQAYANPLTILQAYSASLQSDINYHLIALNQYSPQDQGYYYLANIQPIEQLKAQVDAEIASVQQGYGLSYAGTTFVDSQAGFTTTQTNAYNTLKTNAASAQAANTTAQAKKTTDQSAANAAQTTANQKAAAAATAQTAYNTAQSNATSKRTLSNQAATAATQAQTAATTASQASTTAQTNATQAAAAVAPAQAAADAALAAAQAYEAASAGQGDPVEIAAAYAAAAAAQSDADDAQDAADAAAALATSANSAAATAQAQANSAQALATPAQAAASQAASAASTALVNADAAQATADTALSYAQQLESGPLGGVNLSALGAVSQTKFEYDNRAQLTKSIDAQSFAETYTYDAFGRRASAVGKSAAAAGSAQVVGTTTYTYFKNGLLKSETLPIQAYNSAGSTTGAINVSYAYDKRGNLTTKTEFEGTTANRTTTYGYDELDRLTSTVSDSVTAYTINASTKAVTSSSTSPTEAVSYDANGNVTKTVDAGGGVTVFFYDQLNRKKVEIGATGTYTLYTYDADGNVTNIKIYETTVSVPSNGGAFSAAPAAPSGNKRETGFTYNNLGLMLTSSVVLPSAYKTGTWNGSSWSNATTASLDTSYQYDYLGNVVKVTDPNGGLTFSYYDKLGRKTAQVDAEGYLTDWTYNSEGNVLTERRYSNRVTGTPTTSSPPSVSTNANDRLTTYTYDKVGNRLTEVRSAVMLANSTFSSTSSGTSTITYTYNGLGQVVRKVEATGDQFNYTYDNGGRLTEETRPSFASNNGASVTPRVNYFYDSMGNVVRTVQAAGGDATTARVTLFNYGAGGRLSETIDAAGKSRFYLYDAAGRTVLEYYTRTITGTSGSTSSVIEGAGYRYDALGRSIGQAYYVKSGSNWTFQSGNEYSTIAYNAFGDVTAAATNRSAADITSKGWQQENKYDLAGRLWATNAGDGIWKYFGYDKNGNQTVSITSGGANLTGQTFAGALGLISGSGTNGTYTVYDKRGLATSTTEEGRELSTSLTQNLVSSRTYNAFGDVATETDALNYTASYTYNTMGRMIRKESPTVSITMTDGTSRFVKPSTDYYYDASGRLIATRDGNGTYATGGTSSSGTSKAANTGNLTSLTLLAGTGYGGSDALTTIETHADGGTVTNKYNIFADLREISRSTGTTAGALVTSQTYDILGRVSTVTNNGGATWTYAYDELGHEVQNYNSVDGSGDADVTVFDIQGRVTSQRTLGGDVTTTAFVWNDTATTNAIENFGGWIRTVAGDSSSYTAVYNTDIFGRDADVLYDLAGRVINDGFLNTYYNTGLLKSRISPESHTENINPAGEQITYSGKKHYYSYDALGRLKTEVDSDEMLIWAQTYVPQYQQTYSIGSLYEISQTGEVEYDALGRMTRYRSGSLTTPDADKTWTYDANSNIRSVATTYKTMQAGGYLGTSTASSTLWYAYDSLNRTVVSQGIVSGSNVVAGTTGIALAYDQADRRLSSKTGAGAQEDYVLNAMGLVTEVKIGGVSRSTSSYDALGRINGYIEKTAAGAVVYERFGFTYNSRGQVLVEKSRQLQGSNWNYAHTANYYNDAGFVAGTAVPGALTGSSSTGSSSGMQLYYTHTKNWKNGTAVGATGLPAYGGSNDTAAGDTSLRNEVAFSRTAGWQQTVQTYTNKYGTGFSTWQYNGDRSLGLVERGETTMFTPYPDVYFLTDASGQVLRRWGQWDAGITGGGALPATITYRFGGTEIGMVTNDSTANVDYATLIDRRDNAAGSGEFLGGATSGTVYASFDASHTTLAGGAQGNTPGSWTVRAGDTLQTIAMAVWGDASQWYKIAQANGVSAGGLAEGQILVLPGAIGSIRNNADTIKPYDPAKALGDISPPAAKPPARDRCGFLGAILLAVIGIGVTILTAGAALSAAGVAGGVFGSTGGIATLTSGGLIGAVGPGGAVAIGAASAAVGSIASQGFGVATGLQDSFSWKAVGLAALSGGVGGGMGASFGSDWAAAGARGALSSAISQGIGVATGLQSNFSWSGVAAAGVGAAFGHAVGGALDAKGSVGHGLGNSLSRAGSSTFGSFAASTAASAIANAATRSAIEGSSFGNALVAAIPDVVGTLFQRALGDALTTAKESQATPEVLALLEETSGSTGHAEQQVAANNAAVARSPVATSSGAKGQAVADVVGDANSADYDGNVIVVTAPQLGADVVDVDSPGGLEGTWGRALLDIVGTQGEQRTHLLRYYAQSVGGQVFDENIYAGTADYQRMHGRQLGKALFDEMPVEWSGSKAAVDLLDAMMELSPEYGSALKFARDTYGALREGRDAEVNAQLRRDAQDFAALYAITGVTVLASGGLAAGIGLAGFTGGSAIAVGAVGESFISIASGSASRAYTGSEITGRTLAVDGSIGFVLGGIGARVVAGPRTVVAETSLIPTIRGRAPINSKYAGQVHPSGVRFTEQGFPDFKPYAKAEVRIEGLTGVYRTDAALANAAVGLKRTPNNFVWHHVEDGFSMQLISKSTHNSVRHTGGASVVRNGGFD